MTARATAVSLLLVTVLTAAQGAAATGRSLEATDAEIRTVESLDRALEIARQTTADAPATAPDSRVWLAYRVESVPHTGLCCFRGNCCDLDADEGLGYVGHPTESSEPVLVVVRFEGGEARRLRVFSEGCPIGFSGRTVLWVGDIDTRRSLAFLRRFIDDPADRLAEEALVAAAYHRGAAATQLLAGLAAAGSSRQLAKEAVFWLGTARGREGYEQLEVLLAERRDSDLVKAIVFALHQSPVPQATTRLEELARRDPEARVRREALFWLGQSGSDHAEFILDAALTEANYEVAKHAVFVLSQIPEPENIELLSRALTQKQRPELRKEALFWIGQSSSPDALEVVSRVLNQ